MFAKQHFELIARVVRELPDETTQEQVAEAFTTALASTNSQFLPGRFRMACKP